MKATMNNLDVGEHIVVTDNKTGKTGHYIVTAKNIESDGSGEVNSIGVKHLYGHDFGVDARWVI